MNIEETRSILRVLRLNYPHSFKDLTPEDTEEYLNLWQSFFKDDDYTLVKMAVKSIIASDTREFAPNIGQVKNKMFELQPVKQIDVGSAWDKVLRSARCDRQLAKDEFKKLPIVVQQALGTENFLVELGYSDKESQKYFRKEFESKLMEVLQNEKTDVISGAIPISTMQNNQLEWRDKNEGNLLQEHTTK